MILIKASLKPPTKQRNSKFTRKSDRIKSILLSYINVSRGKTKCYHLNKRISPSS